LLLILLFPTSAFAQDANPQGSNPVISSWRLEYDIPAGTSPDILEWLLQTKFTGTGYAYSIAPKEGDSSLLVLTVQGSGDPESLRQVLFATLEPEYSLLDGTAELSLNAPFTAGEAFTITLEANPSTGYGWQLADTQSGVFDQTAPPQYDNRDGPLARLPNRSFRLHQVLTQKACYWSISALGRLTFHHLAVSSLTWTQHHETST